MAPILAVRFAFWCLQSPQEVDPYHNVRKWFEKISARLYNWQKTTIWKSKSYMTQILGKHCALFKKGYKPSTMLLNILLPQITKYLILRATIYIYINIYIYNCCSQNCQTESFWKRNSFILAPKIVKLHKFGSNNNYVCSRNYQNA